jgi:hypothetical protein
LALIFAVPPLTLNVPLAVVVPPVVAAMIKLLETFSTPVELGPEPALNVPPIEPPDVPPVMTPIFKSTILKVPVSKVTLPPFDVPLPVPVAALDAPKITAPACTSAECPLKLSVLAELAGVPEVGKLPMVMSAVLDPPAAPAIVTDPVVVELSH